MILISEGISPLDKGVHHFIGSRVGGKAATLAVFFPCGVSCKQFLPRTTMLAWESSSDREGADVSDLHYFSNAESFQVGTRN